TFGDRARIDVVGALLAGGGVLALVHAIVRGNDDGWGSASVVIELAVGALLVVAFLGWQMRTRSPLVPLRLFRDRSFSVTNIVGF
ncbi:MFS transporter, partial [Staphylococcus aureus]